MLESPSIVNVESWDVAEFAFCKITFVVLLFNDVGHRPGPAIDQWFFKEVVLAGQAVPREKPVMPVSFSRQVFFVSAYQIKTGGKNVERQK